MDVDENGSIRIPIPPISSPSTENEAPFHTASTQRRTNALEDEDENDNDSSNSDNSNTEALNEEYSVQNNNNNNNANDNSTNNPIIFPSIRSEGTTTTTPSNDNNDTNSRENHFNRDRLRNQIRMMRLQEFVGSFNHMESTSFFKRRSFLTILYLTPMTIALLVGLIVDWEHSCNYPLKGWACGQVALQLLIFLINIAILKKLPPSDVSRQVQQRSFQDIIPYNRAKKTLDFVMFIWFVTGSVWTFQANSNGSCDVTSPFLFRLCFVLIIIQLAIFGLGIFLTLCCCTTLLIRLYFFPQESLIPSSSRGASESRIRLLQSKKYQLNSIPKEDASCAICLCEYEVGENIRYLPCKHHFHQICVDQWLLSNKLCPFCKQDIDEVILKNTKSNSRRSRNSRQEASSIP